MNGTNIVQTELAWAAGFFDGEGHTGLSRKENGSLSPRLTINQTDPGVLSRFLAAVGSSAKLRHYSRNGKQDRKGAGIWQFSIGGTDEIRRIVDLLSPYLSSIKLIQARVVIQQFPIPIILVCPNCGDSFTPKRKKQKTCSRRCYKRQNYRRRGTSPLHGRPLDDNGAIAFSTP
jgi:hypothetical protein